MNSLSDQSESVANRYRTIVADPPWHYQTTVASWKNHYGRNNQPKALHNDNGWMFSPATSPYASMTRGDYERYL